jgi:chaperone required for assembly of F1-ATPase
MSVLRRKRFWKAVGVEAEAGGYAVALDDRPLRTPDRNALVVPSRTLAEGIAAEWGAVEDEIRPLEMPLTRAANVAIDRVAPMASAVAEALAEYGNSDLICYRAEAPEPLVALQAKAWDPLIDWARQDLSANLRPVVGVMHRAQSPDALAALRRAVDVYDPFHLTGLHELVTLSGSLVLGLAVVRGHLAGSEAWPLSRVDELWQSAQWGLDDEAEALARAKRRDFLQAETYLRLLDAG